MIKDIYQRVLRKIAYSVPGGFSIRPMLHRMRGVHIGKDVWISQYVYIDEIHPESVFIGDNTTIGIGTLIIAHFYWGPKKKINDGNVKIENDVFIGPNCVILPDVHIGKEAVIQAGTVVSRNVPSGTLWGAPKAGPIAGVTIPLTKHFSSDQFRKGLRPLNINRAL
ncbi:MAG TPA: acyltransferase [Chitinispirillaceae bacterium]|jgi:acetyltransferase-like isoleucine patch superfamily enzyme|nr:acyltransferase [Chitinispirillaceae bacterium]